MIIEWSESFNVWNNLSSYGFSLFFFSNKISLRVFSNLLPLSLPSPLWPQLNLGSARRARGMRCRRFIRTTVSRRMLSRDSCHSRFTASAFWRWIDWERVWLRRSLITFVHWEKVRSRTIVMVGWMSKSRKTAINPFQRVNCFRQANDFSFNY